MRALAVPAVVLALLAVSGCEKAMRDMYDQPRYKPLAASPVWTDGRSARPLPDGAVPAAAGTIAGTSSGRLQPVLPSADVRPVPLDADGQPLGGLAPRTLPSNPLPVNATTLARGRERYEIFCVPCHGVLGEGDGMVARRGFPDPPSYHIDRLRHAPDAHFFGVMTHGYGVMYSYADRLAPEDRWAIVAYIRALQRSQHASLDDVPADRRGSLEAPGAPRR